MYRFSPISQSAACVFEWSNGTYSLLEDSTFLLELEAGATEDDEEAIFWLELDGSPSLRFEDDETIFADDEEDVAFADEEDSFEELLLDSSLLDPSRLSPLWMTELLLRMTLDDDDFLTLELDGDPGTESGMTSEGEVPLSPPQSARAMVSKRTRMDPIALCAPG